MHKKRSTYILVLILFFSLYSCMQVAKEVKSWMEVETIDDVSGVFHFLDNDGIKVLLPDGFRKYSSVEYQQLLDSLMSDRENEYERKRLKGMREMKGNFYIFFDEHTHSTYTINTLPYMPLYKRDAQHLLGITRLSNEKLAENSNLEFTKITAKYKASPNAQIFKAVYKIGDTKKQMSFFNSSYIVSSNNKTIYLQLTTPFEVFFDPFLQKMIM